MGALGINVPVLVAQLVNFLILFAILALVAYKPITRALDQRTQRIKESMEQAEQVKEQTLKAEERIKAQLDSARQDAQRVLAQADQIGQKLKEEAKVEARKEAEGMLTRAQNEIKLERDQAIDELRREVVDLAILAAEKVIRQSLDPEAHRRLIEEVVRDSDELKKG